MIIWTWADSEQLKLVNKSRVASIYVYDNEETAIRFSAKKAVQIQIRIESQAGRKK
jgi:hypothetical protein